MLNVVLMICKVIGIIIAVLLSILLLLTVEILFIPVRYRVIASKHEEIKAKVNFSWLMRIVFIKIQYEESKLLILIRIFGIPIYDSRKPKKEKKLKKAKKKKQKGITSAKSRKDSKNNTESKLDSTVKIEKEQAAQIAGRHTDDVTKTLEVSQQETQTQKTQTLESHTEAKELHSETKENTAKTKKGMKYRFKQIINYIKTFWEKVKHLFAFLKKIFEYPKKLKEFLSDEDNKSAFKLIFQTVCDLIKHSRPRKLKGEIIFGMDDPCTTGQILGGLSVVYAYLNVKYVKLIPDFSQARLEGDLDARGRVYSFVVLKIVIRLLRDEHFKKFKSNLSQFKEEL